MHLLFLHWVPVISPIAGSISKLFEGAKHYGHVYGRLCAHFGVTEKVGDVVFFFEFRCFSLKIMKISFGFESFVKTTLETPLCDTLSSVIFLFEFSTRGFQELKKGPKP